MCGLPRLVPFLWIIATLLSMESLWLGRFDIFVDPKLMDIDSSCTMVE